MDLGDSAFHPDPSCLHMELAMYGGIRVKRTAVYLILVSEARYCHTVLDLFEEYDLHIYFLPAINDHPYVCHGQCKHLTHVLHNALDC